MEAGVCCAKHLGPSSSPRTAPSRADPRSARWALGTVRQGRREARRGSERERGGEGQGGEGGGGGEAAGPW